MCFDTDREHPENRKKQKTYNSVLLKSTHKTTKEGCLDCVPMRGRKHENRCQKKKRIMKIQVYVPVRLIASLQFFLPNPQSPNSITYQGDVEEIFSL